MATVNIYSSEIKYCSYSNNINNDKYCAKLIINFDSNKTITIKREAVDVSFNDIQLINDIMNNSSIALIHNKTTNGHIKIFKNIKLGLLIDIVPVSNYKKLVEWGKTKKLFKELVESYNKG